MTSVATAVRALRPDTVLDAARTQHALEMLAAARPTGQVLAVCGLHDRAAGSTVAARLADLIGRLHPGGVVVVDADLDRDGPSARVDDQARIGLDDFDAFLRTPSNVEPPWTGVPVVGDLDLHTSSRVAELLIWSRARLDTVVVDIPSRWRRAAFDGLLPGVDRLAVTAQAGQPIDMDVGVVRHGLRHHGRSDLAERLVVVESEVRSGGWPGLGRRRTRDRYRLGPADPDTGWSGLGARDRDEFLRLAAALRR